MVIEIPKGTPEKMVRTILKKRKRRKATTKAVDSFFGKLPTIEDGLKFQKKVRNEWR